jgi:hypothetical protein
MAQTDAKIENYDVIITPPNSNAQFNSQVKFSEELLNIEEGFLVGAVNFNQKIIFPYTLQHVKTGFLG